MALTINGTTGIETNTDTGKIKVGADDDLQLYHDGTHCYLNNSTGRLRIQGDDVRIEKADGAEFMAKFTADGAAELYHNDSKKFETASSGCIVSGDSLKLPDGSAGTPSLTWTDEGNLDTGIFRPAANKIGFSTAGTERFRIESDGGIFFYSLLGNADSGSNVKFSNSDSELRYDTSSKLLKTNITSLTKYGIDTIKKLKPCTFKPQEYNKDGTITVTDKTLIGFIADEMVEEVPEVIQSYPKSTLTKNPDDTEIVPAAISYDKLTVVLTKALQEAITKIETLETKVVALEADD